MKLRNILSWDLIIAVIFALIAALLLPCYVSNKFTHEVYGVGITILAIIFSVYFAALAIIMSSSDNEFLKFFEEIKGFSKLISSFKSRCPFYSSHFFILLFWIFLHHTGLIKIGGVNQLHFFPHSSSSFFTAFLPPPHQS